MHQPTSNSLTILLALCLTTITLTAQTTNSFWAFEDDNKTVFNPNNTLRHTIPKAYRTLSIDINALSQALADAPSRFSAQAQPKSKTISLPLPDGQFKNYRIYKAPIMHPDLAKKYPEIQTFAGYNPNDPSETVRFDISPQGFNGTIYSKQHGTILIAPYSQFNQDYCITYFKKDNPSTKSFTCGFDDINNTDFSTKNNAKTAFAGDCNLRTYELALACTGEYAAFHGGTTPLVLAAFNTSINRVNGVFETDANLTMTLIANTDDLIFFDANTDPYTNNNVNTMLDENQETCDNIIGTNNYDIGHVFCTGGGGVAYLNSPCNSNRKASGVSGRFAPVSDLFDIDYVAHEIGHQFGANHTQNNDCNRSSASVEPGSGSTIMAYSGICAPNVQNTADPYFHAINIAEIANFITGTGNNCATTTATTNNPPTANAGTNYTIPQNTPFVLTGEATDPDDNTLTYCWEQMDSEVATMPPLSTNTEGPAFRTFPPTLSPQRYLPNLAAIVNNTATTWEVLSTVSRSYNWYFTVRDNAPSGSCTAEDNITVTVEASAGPFVLNVPNGSECYTAESLETITWTVANTNLPPVNATTVDILMSTDGGFTYPISLGTGVPNNGSATIIVPNNVGTNNRIMIKGGDHIFFDISDENFEIKPILIGSFCDDGDPCTINDTFDSTLTCTGVQITTDTDNDGICDPADQCPDIDDNIIGTACDDGDAATANDVYDSTCNCVGTPIATCDDGIQNGEETGIDCGGRDCDPCQLDYCASAGENPTEEYIGRVQLEAIDNVSGQSNYTDFTNISTELTTETSYTITVTPTWTGTIYPEGYSVWIDYNQNGDFSDAGEQVWTQSGTAVSPVSGSFTVPASSAYGNTRMRVSMAYDEIVPPCGDFEYGEVEDYTVFINPKCATPGTPCDDNDACTLNDVYDDNCNCIGIFTDTDGDNVCDAEDVCPGFEDGLGTMNLDIRVLMQGAYNETLDEMRTNLQARGLLPGQTPISELATPTAAGHPYAIAPWNYAGIEGENWTDADYPADIVDWLLVSVRTGIEKSSEVAATAALVDKGGNIYFPNQCGLTVAQNAVYLVIEHRSHIGIMTPNPISINNNTLSYDFTEGNTYDGNGTGAGQKEIVSGIWAMYAGDANQMDFPSYDITGSDNNVWTVNNGIFDRYVPEDFNLDGDVNGGDKAVWTGNNGISSRVPR